MFKAPLLQFFSEGGGSTVGHPLVECLEAPHRVVVGVFGQILDPPVSRERLLSAVLHNNVCHL